MSNTYYFIQKTRGEQQYTIEADSLNEAKKKLEENRVIYASNYDVYWHGKIKLSGIVEG